MMNQDDMTKRLEEVMADRAGQPVFLAKQALGQLFDALGRLRGVGLNLTVEEGVPEDHEPEKFPMMVYHADQPGKIVNSEEELTEAEADGFTTELSEDVHAPQVESFAPHDLAGTVPAEPDLLAHDPQVNPDTNEEVKTNPAAPPIT